MENADKIKKDGKNRDFDCIMGLGGGLDSSYCAYIAKEVMGLRPLLLHVDAGWNTDQAVGNIEKIVDGLGLDLYTEVVVGRNKRSASGSIKITNTSSGYSARYCFFLHSVPLCKKA